MASKKDLIKKIESLEENIRTHERKLLSARAEDREVSHWRDEIRGWRREVEHLRGQLNDGGYEEHCPVCQKNVYVRNKKCPKCETHLG